MDVVRVTPYLGSGIIDSKPNSPLIGEEMNDDLHKQQSIVHDGEQGYPESYIQRRITSDYRLLPYLVYLLAESKQIVVDRILFPHSSQPRIVQRGDSQSLIIQGIASDVISHVHFSISINLHK
jgi:hypothetical protein